MNSRIIYPALMLVLGIVAFGRQLKVTLGEVVGINTAMVRGAQGWVLPSPLIA